MSDYLDGCDILGISWGEVGDFGKAAFPFVHAAGGAVLSAFGAGALVDPIENLERRGGLLPPKVVPGVTVTAPDFVLLTYTDNRRPEALIDVAQLAVAGGQRFSGNGYTFGGITTGKFSFGFDAPSKVQVLTSDKRSLAFTGVKQLLVGGGVETGAQTVLGRDPDWRWIFLDPAGELYRSQMDVGRTNVYMPQAAQNVYWRQQRDAARQRSTAQGDLAAARDLHSALRQQQAAQAAAMASYGGSSSPFSGPSPFASSLFDTAPQSAPTSASTPDSSTKEEKGIMSSILDILGLGKSGTGGGTGGAPPPGNRGGGGGKGPTGPTRTPPPAGKGGIVVQQTAGGRQFTSFKVNRDARFNPKKALETAKIVAARAQDVGKKIADKAVKMQKAPATRVHGVVGRPTPVTPAKAARAQMSAAQLAKLAAQTIDAGKKLDTHSGKYAKQIVAETNRVRAGEKRAQQATKVAPAATRVRGVDVLGHDEFDLLDAELTAATTDLDLVGAPTDPDPLHPGYLIDGSPDPAAGGGSAPSGGTTWTPGGMAATLPGPPDFGAGPPPTPDTTKPQPFIDFLPDPYPNGDDPTFYDCPTDDSLPLGAVVFDGSRPIGHMDLGSYTVFFGQLPGSGEPKGGRNSGFSIHGDGKWWLELKGPGGGYNGGHNYDTVSVPNGAMQYESQKNGWGPLMGNPQHYEPASDSWQPGNMFKGLRFSPSGPSGPRWFWYWDMAPDWAKQGVLQSFLNDAITTYKAALVAGQTDYANAIAQDKLDANDAAQIAREQAKVDADTVRRQQQADQQQAEFEQKQLQTETGFDNAYQQQILQQNEQRAQYQAQMEQLQLQYMQQHPELAFPAYGGGGEDEGGGFAPEGGEGGEGGEDTGEGAVDWGDGDDRNFIDEGRE